MQERESPPLALNQAIVISPDQRMVAEIDALLRTYHPELIFGRFQSYVSTRELDRALESPTPVLIFLDASSDPDLALKLMGQLGQQGPKVHVLALLKENNPDFILRCLRAGATNFLLQPFTRDQLDAALVTLARFQPAQDSNREPAKIFSLAPAKGACGASTVACNLAFLCKRAGAKKVLLADLDPLTGTMSFLLKMTSQVSFLDALNHAHEMDPGLWNSIIKNVHGVDVLLAPDLMMDGAQDLLDPSPLLEYARDNYDVIVTDAASVYGAWNLNQFRMATEVLLVTTNELPALQASQRALSYLDSNKVGRRKLKLVVNRYHRDIGLSREVISTALNLEVFETLPSDYVTVQKALLEGGAIPSGTALGKSLIQLADRLYGSTTAPAPKKKSAFSDLLGRFSKK